MAIEGSTVHDALIRPLESQAAGDKTRMPIYRYVDQLLGRIGLVERIELRREESPRLQLRSEADELWALVEGNCTFVWADKRDDSPTHGNIQSHHADSPTLVLAPFGVAFGARTDSAATLIRLATHDEKEDASGVTLPWPDL
jgi:hypothetical protein